ncbi:hypothetical protein BME96_12395 [Virgibacillus halodenitrificans]|uniref:Uncharacterized protein n=1 Tax=Virgibacillus halodenitrificans TaxID=1482 RepID=A0AAC9J0K0_VIRHA|nr:hypothetical protein [Virgibacillus halodenitrificans]APC48943.1 hypothetical protein BME96_12395 [Virgibacillus halodenitrificans]
MLKSEIRKEREARILSRLNKLGVASAWELMRLNAGGLGEGGRRNALRILNEMTEKGLLECSRKEIKIFCVAGRGFGHWEHRMMMNKFLIIRGLFDKAKIEPTVTINGKEFRPDFMVPRVSDPKTANDYVYYEVDRKQKKKANLEKIQRYKELGLRFEIICSPERVRMWKGCVVHEI